MRDPSALRRWLVVAVASAFVATGCGSAGSGGSSAAAPAGAGATTTVGPGGHATAPAASPSAPAASPSGPAAGSTTPSASDAPTQAAPLRLVAIGDSIAQASDCADCIDFVDLYGRAISAAMGRPVDVDDRAAIELSGLPPVEASALLDDILVDPSLRTALAAADIVLISVGFNDTPWNRFDDPCDAANLDATAVRWEQITPSCIARVADEYGQTLDRILTRIDELRGCFTPPGQPADFCADIGRNATLLRLVTVYDDWIGEPGVSADGLNASEAADRAFVDVQCRVIAEHGGLCGDAFHALNGRNGTADAAPFLADDHTHLSQDGHRLVADALVKLGYAPLR